MSVPARPAWFFHRHFGQRHLGVALPHDGGVAFRTAGAADELDLLATDGLSAAALQHLAERAEPLPDPPHFDVPVARPGKILCLGKNFAAHAAEMHGVVPEEPLYFNKLPETLLPHRGTVLLPRWLDSRVDHEIELCVVLGFADPEHRGAKYVTVADALDLVAGFTILNDVTARRLQHDDRKQQHPWLRSKSFDTFCPIGPWVVPRESLPGFGDLEIALEVNGTRRQHSRTSLMVVDVPHAIAFLSRHTTLRPGDLIAMGTPEGVGPLQPGDLVRGRIEQIGELINPVEKEQ